jgi:PAS domain S-box-containing protein
MALTFASWHFYLGCGQFSQHKRQPYATRGMLDLSDWDFAQNGPVALSGEYEFYWHQHLAPERFSQAELPQGNGFIQVPGDWNGYKLDGKKLSGEGYATYRLRVQLKDRVPLALKFLDMATAYTVYVNGTKLFSAGIPETTPEATVPQYFPQVVDCTPASGQLEILFHIANFHHKRGGAWEPIQLGLQNQLHQARAQALQLDVLLFGCIVIMGLYHLGLFAVRTSERAPLYFGIFCLLIALRLIVISERLLLQLFPQINWELLGKIEYLAYYLAPPTGAMFLHALYRDDFPPFSIRTILTISTVFCGVVLVTPVRVFSHTVSVHHAYTILCCLYGVSVIILCTVRQRESSKINLVGFSLLFLAILNDILNYFYIINTPLLLPFGLLAFIFSQAILLSFRFSKAFRTIDWQRFKLEEANRQYEKELIERKRLEEQYRALYDDNPTMYFTVDANGVVLSVNQFGREYLGYCADELIGQPVLKVFHGDDKTLVQQQLATCLQDPHRVHDWELRKIRKDGSILWVKEFARCMQNSDGQALVLIVCEDITDRKQAEEKLHTSRERLRALGAYLQSMLEQERVRVARNLHDELGQGLTSLKMGLSLLGRQIENADGKFEAPTILREIGSMQKLIVIIINQVRNLITELRPAILDTLGLMPALEWQLEEFHKRTSLAYEFHSEVKELEITKEHAVAVFRIFQEVLNNVARHAQAGKVEVDVAKHDQALWVEIADNGRGITTDELNAPGKFGLLGMRERASVFGGEVCITGAPGLGTTVKIKVPIPGG